MHRVLLALSLAACSSPPADSSDERRGWLAGPPLQAAVDGALDGAHPGDGLGTSAAAGDFDGDGHADLLVGIPGWDAPFTDAGRVELYPGGPAGLSSTPTWFAEGEQAGSALGAAVALAGDLDGDGLPDFAAGAPGHDGMGRVYVWRGGSVALFATVDGTATGEAFGAAIASAGDVDGDGDADLLIGAPGAADGGVDAGRAELCLGSPTGLGAASWSTTGQPGWRLGAAVAGAGDVDADGYAEVLVGAPEADAGAGRALLFPGGAVGPGALAWTAIGEAPGDHLGASVAGLGDVDGDGHADVLVGAPDHEVVVAGPWSPGDTGAVDTDTGAAHSGGVDTDVVVDTDLGHTLVDAGQALLYLGGPGGLPPAAVRALDGDIAHMRLGARVAAAGDIDGSGFADAVVSAPGDRSERGMLLVLHGGPDGLVTAWRTQGAAPGDRLGAWAGSAGDLNGDGLGDLFFTSPGAAAGAGRLGVVHGNTRPLADVPSWQTGPARRYSTLGWVVSTAGDVDGDGYDDIVAGDPAWEQGRTPVGRVVVYRGGPDGPSTTPDWSVVGTQASPAGLWVAPAGDVNGDGFADLLISEPWYERSTANPDLDEGRVMVYHGSPTGFGARPDWEVAPRQAYVYGMNPRSAGDLNGDGYSDIAVWGAVGGDHVYLGGPTGLADTPAWDVALETSFMDGAGDVNGDGYDDLIVGEQYWGYGIAGGGAAIGRASIYLGSPTGPSEQAVWEAFGQDTGFQTAWNFGQVVAGVGDLNGDGYSDVAVGSPMAHAYSGRVDLFFGSPTGPAPAPSLTLLGTDYQRFGANVSSAGDLNGDGYGDLAVRAPMGDAAATVQVYLGGPDGPTLAWRLDGLAEDESLTTLATAGDVNGDGYADLLLGDPDMYGTGVEGTVSIYAGNGGASGHWSVGMRAQARSAELRRPLLPGLTSSATDRFGVALDPRGPWGRGRARLQVQVAPAREGWENAQVFTQEDWSDGSAQRMQLLLDGLAQGGGYRWRARALLDPAHGLPFAATAWKTGGRSGDSVRANTWTQGWTWYLDQDGDGHGQPDMSLSTRTSDPPPRAVAVAGDCDDHEGRVNPGAQESCGGGGIDEDCDGVVDNDPPVEALWYPDLDGDGFGASGGVLSCPPLPGHVLVGTDCDDANTAVHPGADERCGEDLDCDGLTDEADAVDAATWYLDQDEDGYAGAVTLRACSQPPNASGTTTDCDDTSAAVSPAATETCAPGDEDCDGLTGDADPTVTAPAWFPDADGDGYGAPLPITACTAPTGHVLQSGDCDDGRPDVNPDVAERCDASADEDCDGAWGDDDPDLADGLTWYADLDEDGYGGAVLAVACTAPPGGIARSGDCDDADADRHPGAAEVPGVGADLDCSGDWTCFVDADGDGHGDGHRTQLTAEACTSPGLSPTGDDCDDTQAGTYPGAPETAAAGIDADCSGAVSCFLDADHDGYGADAVIAGQDPACRAVGEAPTADDCDDGDPGRHPGAAEVPGLADDLDCSGDWTCFVDADGDGHGDGLHTQVTAEACTAPGLSPTGDDCDDTQAATFPGAPETAATGVDADCSGAPSCFLDADHDGYGADTVIASQDPACGALGEAPTGGDCDDGDPTRHPGEADVAGDAVDQDCDGRYTCFLDEDADGWGQDALTDVEGPGCEVAGAAIQADDCDDADASVHPAARELPDNAVDEDCDGEAFVTETEVPATPTGCACDAGGGGAAWLAVVAVVVVGRRRRPSGR